MKANHIGIISNDIKRDKKIYEKLGYSVIVDIIDNIQNNWITIMRAKNSIDIELIMAINENSSVRNMGNGYHHICYEAEPGEDIIQKFKKLKIGKIFTPPIVAPALNNRKVVFACLQNGTFIEFILS